MSKNSDEKDLSLKIKGYRRVEEGVEFDFDLSEEFIAAFKKHHGLKRWSQRRFDDWVTDNQAAIMRAVGLVAVEPEEE